MYTCMILGLLILIYAAFVFSDQDYGQGIILMAIGLLVFTLGVYLWGTTARIEKVTVFSNLDECISYLDEKGHGYQSRSEFKEKVQDIEGTIIMVGY